MRGTPALLHVLLFAAGLSASRARRDVDVRALVARLESRGLSVGICGCNDRPPDVQPDTPAVYLSVGKGDIDFDGLYALPLSERRRWLHYSTPDKVGVEAILYCWLSATDPLAEAPPPAAHAISGTPLVSVFTAAYRTGARLQRAYKSLLSQTYVNWEWVIADDSGDGGETFRQWISGLDDPRVVKLAPGTHSGRIGTVKRHAADHCRGEILVELDHDDELTPEALGRIVAAMTRHPDCGFAFGEAAEVYEDGLASHWYGWDAGFGFLAYWRQWDPELGRTVDVPRTPSTNWLTVRHLVGLPNHPRAWARWAYDAAGGYRPGLTVADDYDLLVRSLLVTQPLRVPDLLYRQYLRPDRGNQTFVRNEAIQVLCERLGLLYGERIDARLKAWDMPPLDGEYRRIWRCEAADPRWLSAERQDLEDAQRVAHLFLFPPGGDPSLERRLHQRLDDADANGWETDEIVVVGQAPESLLVAAAPSARAGRLRWWTTGREWGRDETERYGRLISSAPTVITHATEGSGQGWPSSDGRDLTLCYVEAFTPAGPADRRRNRLMLLKRLQESFGYRRYLEIGTDRDEVFSRMTGLDLKVGVDPHAGGTHRMTSDAYFAWNRAQPPEARHRFDLVLIDGLHEAGQILRDVDNALTCLEPGGTILIHDCMPFEERHQIVPRPMPIGFWTGDSWKAIFQLRQRPDIDIAVGCFDWGVAALRVRPSSRPFTPPRGEPESWRWDDYLACRAGGLNPLGWAALLEWLGIAGAPSKPGRGTAAEMDLHSLAQHRLMLAAYCADGQVSEDFLHATVRLKGIAERIGLHLQVKTLSRGTRGLAARAMATAFIESDCSHLVVVEPSQGFDVDDLVRLFSAERDTVAASGAAAATRQSEVPSGSASIGTDPPNGTEVGMVIMDRLAVKRATASLTETTWPPSQALFDAWRQLLRDE